MSGHLFFLSDGQHEGDQVDFGVRSRMLNAIRST